MTYYCSTITVHYNFIMLHTYSFESPWGEACYCGSATASATAVLWQFGVVLTLRFFRPVCAVFWCPAQRTRSTGGSRGLSEWGRAKTAVGLLVEIVSLIQIHFAAFLEISSCRKCPEIMKLSGMYWSVDVFNQNVLFNVATAGTSGSSRHWSINKWVILTGSVVHRWNFLLRFINWLQRLTAARHTC